MTTTIRALFIALLTLSFAGCQEGTDEAPEDAVATAPVPLTAPTTDDDAAWGEYLTEVVRRNLGGISNSPYLYYLPAESTPGFEGEYGRLLEKSQVDIARGILAGNMLAFGSPASSKMADLIIASFADVDPGSMEGVRVLFIGDAADNQRVQEALAPSGVAYVFVEAS
ncbi:MAG TPA: hypothetical protein VFS99_01320 [Xanthomonadaceae bacterium]|nr:hypothetical protein [Xanthomonadaceae bacterium]